MEKLAAVAGSWLGDVGDRKVTSLSEVVSVEDGVVDDNVILPVMDWDHFAIFTDNDPAQERELINLFVSYGQETFISIEDAATKGTRDEWKLMCHKMKGSAANLGALALARSCAQAEEDTDTDAMRLEERTRQIRSDYITLLDVLLARCEQHLQSENGVAA